MDGRGVPEIEEDGRGQELMEMAYTEMVIANPQRGWSINEWMNEPMVLIMQYFGTRGSAGQLALTVLEGTVEGKRYQGKPRKQWMDDIK